jgi:hypothetical protein
VDTGKAAGAKQMESLISWKMHSTLMSKCTDKVIVGVTGAKKARKYMLG